MTECRRLEREQSGLLEKAAADAEDAALKRRMVEAAQRIVVVAEERQRGRRARFPACPLDAVDLLVTQDAAAPPARTRAADGGTRSR